MCYYLSLPRSLFIYLYRSLFLSFSLSPLSLPPSPCLPLPLRLSLSPSLSLSLSLSFSPFSHFVTISLYRADHFVLVIRIFDIVPCRQSVGISSCLPLCCPSVSFSVDLCFFSHKLLGLAIPHIMWLCSRLKQCPNHFSLLFSRKVSTDCLLPGVFISDVVQPGLPSFPSQHPHLG